MSKVLVTFSGKTGDILWSLPTARELAKKHSEDGKVDFAVMPAYTNLLPLLVLQSYIGGAFTVGNWECTGSPHGDQPWEPPKSVEEGYDKVFHLTYRQHPGYGEPLIDFIAKQQGIDLTAGAIPFIDTVLPYIFKKPVVAYAFNEMHAVKKAEFIKELMTRFPVSEVEFIDVAKLMWPLAATVIKQAVCFIGCRSANYVLAHGTGTKVFCFEPELGRKPGGPWGITFGPGIHALEYVLSTEWSGSKFGRIF